jgi:hypothetical protein
MQALQDLDANAFQILKLRAFRECQKIFDHHPSPDHFQVLWTARVIHGPQKHATASG